QREEILRDRHAVIGAQTRAQAMVERLLNGRRAMAHGHVDRDAERDVTSAILDQSPSLVVDSQAMYVFVPVPQQPGAPEREQLIAEISADEMLDDRNPHLAGEREYRSIEIGRQGQGKQLVFRAEIAALQPFD